MSVWDTNLAILKKRRENGDLTPPCPIEPPVFENISLTAAPHLTIKMSSERGQPVTLHSPRDPWKEADCLVQRVPMNTSRPLVVLGFGLGYHLLRLLPRLEPDRLLVVVEKEAEVFQAALASLDLTPLLTRPRTILVVHPHPGEAAKHLRGRLALGNGRPVDFWGHPASLRTADNFYQEVIRALKPPTLPSSRPLGLKKEKLKVLIINPDYFLIPEVHIGFRQLGHEVQTVLFDKRREQGEVVIARVMQSVRAFNPDLVFTINHLGFDREGVLLTVFHRLRLPSVSWYVDSPTIILNLYQGPRSELAAIFVWDASYIPEVKDLGFNCVFPLPLATDANIFRPRSLKKGRRWQARVSFVGNSMLGSVAKKLDRLPGSEEFLRLFEQLSASYRNRPFRRLEALLAEAGLEQHPMVQSLSRTERTDLEAAIIWAATRDYRLSCVRRLAPFRPRIFGDSDWRRVLSAPFEIRPEVNYFEELPLVYNASDINFNATSLQMKTAVNQRVFDVPAAGGFLLTDFREQLAELFRIGEEVICYRQPEEIPDLVDYYLRHEGARRRIVQRGRERVLAEHTYRHRLTTMLTILRQTI